MRGILADPPRSTSRPTSHPTGGSATRSWASRALLLRTTGRRSGATRTNALVYARDGDDYLVVASNGGADRAPAWLHNLRANPDVEIQIGRDRQPATARVVEQADPDFERLWTLVTDNTGPLPGLSGEDGPADPGHRAHAYLAGSGTIRM